MKESTRFKRFTCWLFYGHRWDKTGSKQMMSREMNRCELCNAYAAGPD